MSTFVTQPKKSNKQSWEDNQLNKLRAESVPHNSSCPYLQKVESSIIKTHFGFRAGLGTREALFAVQVLVQRCTDDI